MELIPPDCQKFYKDLMPANVTHVEDDGADSMQSDLEDLTALFIISQTSENFI